jgi:3-deoxy-D-manno-octulosonic-acid transferase
MTAAPGARPATLKAYGVAASLAEPFARRFLEDRARRGKEDPGRLAERLGQPSAPRPSGSLVWLHAVSVGESVSLLPVIERLAADRPDLTLLVTSGTRASAEMLATRLPAKAIHQYAPLDTPGAVARFLAHWRPDLGLFVESELWPNLILAAHAGGTRLALISARMTERSARAWRRWPAAARAVLGAFDLILAQDDAVGTRLTDLGAHVAGRLNLKRLGAPAPADATEADRLKFAIGGRPVVLALSTHAPEEAMIAAAVRPLTPVPLLILQPRHRERGDDLARQFAGRRLARRSAGETPSAQTEIYLVDTLGETGLLLRLGDLAVMGGGFGHGVGGHNPLEPARLGVGVITGPDIANHAQVFAEMIAAGAALPVDGEAGLTAALSALLGDEARRRAMGAAALAFAEAQDGQLDLALDAIRPLLPAKGRAA